MNPVEAGTAMGITMMAVGPPSNSIPMIFDPVASLALSQDLCHGLGPLWARIRVVASG